MAEGGGGGEEEERERKSQKISLTLYIECISNSLLYDMRGWGAWRWLPNLFSVKILNGIDAIQAFFIKKKLYSVGVLNCVFGVSLIQNVHFDKTNFFFLSLSLPRSFSPSLKDKNIIAHKKNIHLYHK